MTIYYINGALLKLNRYALYVSFIDNVLFYFFCWLFLKTSLYALSGTAIKVIKYSSVADKRAQSLFICGIEFTFTVFIQIEVRLK